MKKLSKIKLAEISTIMSEEEMKTLKGGFDCGGSQTYWTGSCGSWEFSICANGQADAIIQAGYFCSGY